LTSDPSSQGRTAGASIHVSEWVHRHRLALSLVFSIWLIFYFFPGLNTLPLLEPDEGRNAEVAREMLRGGDWITPHYNGYPYLDKPAPFFWMVAASFKAFGISEWAARLPSGLAAFATLLLIGLLARRMFGPEESVLAGLVLVTSPLFLIFSRQVIFDMTLTFLITAAFVLFWWEESKPDRRLIVDLAMFAAMGLATITKGPVGFLLPLLAILVYSILRGGMSRFKRLHWGLGLAAFFAVVLPWFIAVSVKNPDFPRYALWQESLVRFTTGSARRSGGVFYYLPVYLGGFFPWSFLLLYAAFPLIKGWKALKEERNAPLAFLVSFVLVVFVFFTISRSKLPGYFLPALGPLSILTAHLWNVSRSRGTSRSPDWLIAGFATIVVVGLLMFIAPRLDHVQTVHARLAKKMPGSIIELAKTSLTFTGILLAALGILGRDLAVRAKRIVPPTAALAVLILTTPLMMLQWRSTLALYARVFSSQAIAKTIKASEEHGLPVFGYYYFRTGLPFYLESPVGIVTSGAEEMTSNYVSSRWPNIQPELTQAGFEVSNDLEGQLEPAASLVLEKDWHPRTSTFPTLVLVRNSLVPSLFKSVGTAEPLWTEWEFSVWKVSAPAPAPSAQGKIK
jgi:4-amino-4-deoxy-L-arabinose transferase-like glycosyltransferase